MTLDDWSIILFSTHFGDELIAFQITANQNTKCKIVLCFEFILMMIFDALRQPSNGRNADNVLTVSHSNDIEDDPIIHLPLGEWAKNVHCCYTGSVFCYDARWFVYSSFCCCNLISQLTSSYTSFKFASHSLVCSDVCALPAHSWNNKIITKFIEWRERYVRCENALGRRDIARDQRGKGRWRRVRIPRKQWPRIEFQSHLFAIF